MKPKGALKRAFPAGLRTTPFAEPLYDTIALVRRRGHPLSRATRELARLAEDTLRELRTDLGL